MSFKVLSHSWIHATERLYCHKEVSLTNIRLTNSCLGTSQKGITSHKYFSLLSLTLLDAPSPGHTCGSTSSFLAEQEAACPSESNLSSFTKNHISITYLCSFSSLFPLCHMFLPSNLLTQVRILFFPFCFILFISSTPFFHSLKSFKRHSPNYPESGKAFLASLTISSKKNTILPFG